MTSLDFLYIALGVSVFLVSIFLSIMFYNIALTMKETNRVLQNVDDTVDQVNRYLALPLKLFIQAQDIVTKLKDKYEFTHGDGNEKTR